MIRAIVKGDETDVYLAAALRHIDIRCSANSAGTKELVVWVEDDYREAMTKWFCEPCGDAPFPAGTLLYYA